MSQKLNLKTQTELIQQQKKEIENLRVTQATEVNLHQLVTVIWQAMSCLYVGNKTPSDNQDKGGKRFVWTSTLPQTSYGDRWVPWYKYDMLVL